MNAVGYIRQSRRADLDVALSHESQLYAIRRMAERDGINPDAVTILADMGRSGGAGKERQRAAYQELLAGIADGTIGTVYALSMSRLARSVKELLSIYEKAAERGIRIVYEKEGEARFDTPDGKMRATILAAVYEFERDLSVERARDNVRIRRARGEQMGRAPYGSKPGESPEAVAAAYRETGTFNKAALRLNEQGIPSPLGRQWSGTGLRLVLQRHNPELMPLRPTRGVKPSSPFLLYRVLRCHCGKPLTASRDLRQANRQVVYRCHAASVTPNHGPYRVAEGDILPWIKGEAARLQAPDARMSKSDAGKRTSLTAEKERLGWAVADGLLPREKAQERGLEIDKAIEALDEEERVVKLPQVDWTWEPAAINEVLRTLWHHVELDPTMKPVKAEWKVPEWRG